MSNSSFKILIFRIGQLGDMLVTVPTLWVLRNKYPYADITMFSDVHTSTNYTTARDVFEKSPLINNFITYNTSASLGPLRTIIQSIKTLIYLRRQRFNLAFYLAPSRRNKKQAKRDELFFKIAGIKTCIGFKEFYHLPAPPMTGSTIPVISQEADLLLQRINAAGIRIPPLGEGRTDLAIGHKEFTNVESWSKSQIPDGDRPWFAVGPGSKMPSKKWPVERFQRVVQHLINKHDIWPVVFGSTDDIPNAKLLISKWGRGHIAAGDLNIRESISALSRCCAFLGNDTGTMHMAVSASLRCIAIFSSRDYPGHWDPYGSGHIVLRQNMSCSGCLLESCVEKNMSCLLSIDETSVINACENILRDYFKTHHQ